MNGELHPLNHADINYSSEATFKIEAKNFIDILDVNIESHYIQFGRVQYRNNR